MVEPSLSRPQFPDLYNGAHSSSHITVCSDGYVRSPCFRHRVKVLDLGGSPGHIRALRGRQSQPGGEKRGTWGVPGGPVA